MSKRVVERETGVVNAGVPSFAAPSNRSRRMRPRVEHPVNSVPQVDRYRVRIEIEILNVNCHSRKQRSLFQPLRTQQTSFPPPDARCRGVFRRQAQQPHESRTGVRLPHVCDPITGPQFCKARIRYKLPDLRGNIQPLRLRTGVISIIDPPVPLGPSFVEPKT